MTKMVSFVNFAPLPPAKRGFWKHEGELASLRGQPRTRWVGRAGAPNSPEAPLWLSPNQAKWPLGNYLLST